MNIQSITDLDAISTLLAQAALPVADIAGPSPPHFFGLHDGAGLAGVVGLELYPPQALMRSLAVRPDCRGQGLGQALVAHAEAVAAASGVDTVYLLTTTAEAFFLRLGYAPAVRAAAPAAIRRTSQFAGLCPASSTFMVKPLAAAGGASAGQPAWRIRDETPADAGAIAALTAAAFAPLEISRHTEHFIVEALRAAGALTLSLVAEEAGQVVGHIAFSPVAVADGSPGWFGLGPVSVLPARQRQGIGAALIEAGLARLQAQGARGCCLVGHPAYYPRFGFEHPAGLGLAGVPPEVFFARAFGGPMPWGTVSFHPAFMADGPPSGA